MSKAANYEHVLWMFELFLWCDFRFAHECVSCLYCWSNHCAYFVLLHMNY